MYSRPVRKQLVGRPNAPARWQNTSQGSVQCERLVPQLARSSGEMRIWVTKCGRKKLDLGNPLGAAQGGMFDLRCERVLHQVLLWIRQKKVWWFHLAPPPSLRHVHITARVLQPCALIVDISFTVENPACAKCLTSDNFITALKNCRCSRFKLNMCRNGPSLWLVSRVLLHNLLVLVPARNRTSTSGSCLCAHRRATVVNGSRAWHRSTLPNSVEI